MRKPLLTVFLSLMAFWVFSQEVPNLQKPLFTKIAATWCPPCGTWGWTFMEDVIGQNGDDALIIGAHHSGRLLNPAAAFINDALGGFSQPLFYIGNERLNVRFNNSSEMLTEANTKITTQLTLQPDVGVGMNISATNSEINVHTKTRFFNAVEGQYFLALYLVEDEVVEEQASIGPNAIHPFILRAMFSEQGEGVEIADGAVAQDTESEHDFTLLRQPEWNLDNSYIYAMIWKKEDDKFIYQNGHSEEIMNTVSSTHDEMMLSEVRVFPTVSEGLFRIEMPNEAIGEAQVMILDHLGRQHKQMPSHTEVHSTIDLTDTPAGNYIIRVQIRGTQRSIPVVKVN